MLEPVVATNVAGPVGVMLAVAVVKHPWIESKMRRASANIRLFRLKPRCWVLARLCSWVHWPVRYPRSWPSGSR
jgi:hypothetical protein